MIQINKQINKRKHTQIHPSSYFTRKYTEICVCHILLSNKSNTQILLFLFIFALFEFSSEPRLLGGIFAAWWSSGAVHRDTRGKYIRAQSCFMILYFYWSAHFADKNFLYSFSSLFCILSFLIFGSKSCSISYPPSHPSFTPRLCLLSLSVSVSLSLSLSLSLSISLSLSLPLSLSLSLSISLSLSLLLSLFLTFSLYYRWYVSPTCWCAGRAVYKRRPREIQSVRYIL